MTSATWGSNPSSGLWNDATNWAPPEVPNGTATFSQSSQTAISFAQGTSSSVGTLLFDVSAPAYQFSFTSPALPPSTAAPLLSISGSVASASPWTQVIVVAASAQGYQYPQLEFTGSASAGGLNVLYNVGPATPSSGGGGVVGFYDNAIAGSASFIVTTGSGSPAEPSTVGGEVSFNDSSSAAGGQFTVYGTTGSDGYTFGNVVFRDTATAGNGNFTNVGGTMYEGDGGNTQFYDNATAGQGNFINRGGTVSGAYGGDVAFDCTANGGSGHFSNQAAAVTGGYGGVTSFNNNPPQVSGGASAGWGSYHNYGATSSSQGGGGHVELTALSGSPTAGNGSFVNEGSVLGSSSTAGHTILSISPESTGTPTGGNGRFLNRPAPVANGSPGYTEFTVYTSSGDTLRGASSGGVAPPTAGAATLVNEGATVSGAYGGATYFYSSTTAANATLVALGGSNGGYGGRIVLADSSSGGSATVQLVGNGSLDVSAHTGGVSIGSLTMNGGQVVANIGSNVTTLSLTGALTLNAGQAYFQLQTDTGFAQNVPYPILTAPNLASFSPGQFAGSSVGQVAPTFSISGNTLSVTFNA